MNNSSPHSQALGLLVHLQDCALASLAMGAMYLVAGVEGLVIVVFGFSLSVVILLLLIEAYVHCDCDDDDPFDC